ncbi:hypothetical protein FisN_10Hh375 [Fistulifera solaris]|uniref:Uncharacterized protein n=1 Tax=Fistulifera solaris TaxID=1519565 RepID=A0A1Z5JQV1_FISSO|nr:hypothetical protein FisN_10Hh375 [Fistulifera solaris]|eukprot:GAX16394.1 hypothetical protein FisN_10Hh375 [Fistulifera solaris]
MSRPNESLHLLQHIPKDQLSSQLKAVLPENVPFYMLLREPASLTEFHCNQPLAIWRENGTLLVWNCDEKNDECFRGRHLHFRLKGFAEIDCAIYGEHDTAIAETFTYFTSLPHPADTTKKAVLQCYCDVNSRFDFVALQPEQLTRILDSNPTRRIELTAAISAEQAHVLATRPYPLDLMLVGYDFAFLDRGTAFVEALEHRESSFGSLFTYCGEMEESISSSNLKRLLELENIFQELQISSPNEECVLLPFLAKVDVLDYRLYARYMEPDDFFLLNIVAKDLTLKFIMDGDDEWSAISISFLIRVAELGHFVRFSFAYLCLSEIPFDPHTYAREVAMVVGALIVAVNANPKLLYLDLSDDASHVNWGPFFKYVFDEVKDHPSLCTIVVRTFNHDSEETGDEDEKFERRYCFHPAWLKQLLAHNRNIVVLDESGNKCTNGSTIDEAYALNVFYNQSLRLVNESCSVLRPLLVESALTERASANVQYTALLLWRHVDTLCEFIHGVDFEDAAF